MSDYYQFLTAYQMYVKPAAVGKTDPLKSCESMVRTFVTSFRRDPLSVEPSEMYGLASEYMLYRNGRPYYKIFPEFITALCSTSLRKIPAKHFRLPFSAWEIRLPQDESLNPLRIRDRVVRAILVSDMGLLRTKIGHPDYDALLSEMDFVQSVREHQGVPEEHIGQGTHIEVQFGATANPQDDFYFFEEFICHNELSLEGALQFSRERHQRPDTEVYESMDQLWRLVVTMSFLITGGDKLIEPDVLAADLQRFTSAKTTEEIEKLHDRATRRRNDGRGYTVGRRERLLSIAKQRRDECDAKGAPLKFQHQRCGHLHRAPTKDGYKVIWIPQLTVRADLPVDPRMKGGVKVK